MAHARQQIRDAVVTALTGAGLTTYSSRVYSTASLPSVNVTTPSEESEADVTNTGGMARVLTVQVDLMIEATSDVDDAADTQSVTIEKSILTDSSLLALVQVIDLLSVDSDLSGEGDKPILVMTHTFGAQYRINESDPEVIL